MDTKASGFTLIELLIAAAVGLIVLAAVSALFSVQSKHFAESEIIAELHQNVRIAMDMMVREISMAGYNQLSITAASTGTTPVPRCTNALVTAGTPCVGITTTGITSAGTASISFLADRTPDGGDGDIADADENIVYDVYTSDGVQALGRTSNGVKNPVVNHVEYLNFKYFKEDGSTPTDRQDIQRVKIEIRVRSSRPDPNYTDATYGDHYRHYTLSSFAFLRNLALE